MKNEYFRISNERVQQIAAEAGMEPERVREYCTADWPEGEEHQTWLDTASIHEISSWCSRYEPQDQEETP
jgi:hypothetical protein